MAGRDTQEKLINTAERLFAEHGFDGVTFKQITTEAGQRNASALQYHFGTKQALVRAIVLRRTGPIDARRCALIDALESEGRSNDLRAIVDAMVRPLAEHVDGGSIGATSYYIRFLSQVLSNPHGSLTQIVADQNNEGVLRAGMLAAALMTHLPPEIIRQRLTALRSFVIVALADYERGLLGDAESRPELSLYLSNLIDAIVGMLEQPASAQTLAELDAAAASVDPCSNESRTTRSGVH
jgi:AcrR family transcriptional regulator